MQSSIDLKMASNTYQNTCQKLHYLVARQRELCGLDRNILQVRGPRSDCAAGSRNPARQTTTQ